jgi:hypothetical protein
MGNGNPSATGSSPATPAQSSAAPSTTAGSNGAAPAPAAAPWYANFGDADLRGWTELKKFENPEAAMKSAREAEKLIGVPKDQLVRIPQPNAEGVQDLNPVYDRLGRPKTPEEYRIPTVEGGEEFAKTMAPLLHRVGMNQAQVEQLATGWNTYMKTAVDAQNNAQALEEQADLTKLHQEWPGQTYTEREEMGRRYARQVVAPALGITNDGELAEVLGNIEEAIGTAKFLKIMAKGGESLGEGRFVAGRGNPTFGMTPEGARARMKELNADADFRARVMRNGKDGPEMQEMDRLARVAAGNLPR